MRIKSNPQIKTAVLCGLLIHGNFLLAQSFLPGERIPDYRPIGALVFRGNDSAVQHSMDKAAIHTSYVIYISTLQRALFDNNPQKLEEQAKLLQLSGNDVERLYTVLNEFNTRSSEVRHATLQQECGPVRAGQTLTIDVARDAVARIDTDEPREEILQGVLQTVRDAFGEDVVQSVQSRVTSISESPQFRKLENVERIVRDQGVDYVAYLNEQCAVL